MLHGDVLPALQDTFNPLLDDGRLWRLQFDTYEREVERYGGADGIILAESLFHLDSEVTLELIEMLEPGDQGMDERWRLTLYGIDLLLMDFGLDLKGKLGLLKKLREGFAQEFRLDKNLTSQLSEKFRQERRSVENLLAASGEPEHPLAPGLAVLHQRSTQMVPIVAALRASEENRRLSGSIAELVPSYIHMHANRLLRSAHRLQEFVIYDLLIRVYESQLARML
jgi:thiopeptide-type bacteriocin biosynthesis protein